MATAIFLHPASSSSFEWYRRMADSLGLDFVSTDSVGETLTRMEERHVPLVLLSSNVRYRLDDAIFPIKARHGEAKVVVVSANSAPERVPPNIDAWICVAEHEAIVRCRLKGSMAD